MKAVMAAFDALAIVALLRLLTLAGRDRDAGADLRLAAAAGLGVRRQRPYRCGRVRPARLGATVSPRMAARRGRASRSPPQRCTKFLPGVVLPAFWRPWTGGCWRPSWRRVGAFYAPYLGVGWRVFGFLGGYVQEENLVPWRRHLPVGGARPDRAVAAMGRDRSTPRSCLPCWRPWPSALSSPRACPPIRVHALCCRRARPRSSAPCCWSRCRRITRGISPGSPRWPALRRWPASIWLLARRAAAVARSGRASVARRLGLRARRCARRARCPPRPVQGALA